MLPILLEGLLFVASIATIAALVFFLTRSTTPLGLRSRQNRNRELIEREAELVCPVHGAHTEEQLVRLSFAVARAFRDDIVVRAGARLWTERSLIAAPFPPPFIGWIDAITTASTAIAVQRVIVSASDLRMCLGPRPSA